MANTAREWTTNDAIRFGGPTAQLVIDTLLNKELRVTKQMIRDGRKQDCGQCPVALAILAVLPNAEVHADLEFISVDGVRFEVPKIANRFMNRFDYTINRESMRGIEFVLKRTVMYYSKWSVTHSPQPQENRS